MTAIFVLSSMTPAEIERASSPAQGLPLVIKPMTAHMVEFGVLAALIYRLLVSYRYLAAGYMWLAVLLLAIGYGATDELHQGFVQGRCPSWLDLGCDSLGAFAGLLIAEVTALVHRARST